MNEPKHCSQKDADGNPNCPNPVLFRYTWPGRDEAYACVIHATALLSIAEAFGLHLQMIRLDLVAEALGEGR